MHDHVPCDTCSLSALSPRERTRSVVISQFGIVATSQTPASQAGGMILELALWPVLREPDRQDRLPGPGERFDSGATLSNPFRNGIIVPPVGTAGLNAQIGTSLTFVNPGRVSPYNQQWQFSAQRELSSNIAVEAAYGGRSWGSEMILRDDGCWDLGYPPTVQRADGRIVTVYSFNNDPRSERYIAATIWKP